MVKVNLWSGLRHFTDGQVVVEVEAQTIGHMIDALVGKYPGLGPIFEGGISVAVDGDIVPPDTSKSIDDSSEIYLLQQMKGG